MMDRIRNINRIKELIVAADKQGNTASKEKLISFIKAERWVAERTAQDYIKTLEGGNFIKIDGDIIKLVNQTEKHVEAVKEVK